MHNFAYLAQRRNQEFSCEPNFGGRAPAPPLGCATAAETATQLPPVTITTGPFSDWLDASARKQDADAVALVS